MTKRSWLDGDQVARFLADCADDLCDLILELRDVVRETAPEVHEAIKFNALCYYKPDRPYGAIGGNVCMISVRKESVYLSFIHGAFLPDAHGLLEGRAKAKRHIKIGSPADVRNPAIQELIRAAVAYQPVADDDRTQSRRSPAGQGNRILATGPRGGASEPSRDR